MSAAEATVTVVILNHNGGAILDLLAESLRALRGSAGLPGAQVIVVDDNSTDGSDSQAAALCSAFGAEFASTRDGKHGVGAARNVGLLHATGRLIAFLDNDAVPEAGWLAALVAFMDAHPSSGACASRVMFSDKPDIVNSMGSVLNELFHGNGVGIHEMYEFATVPDQVMYATGNGMMLRRAALDQVGTFDEGYLFWGADDADLGLRLRRAGWTIHAVPNAVVMHLHSFSKTAAGMPFWDGRNRVRMALKHLSWRELPGFAAVDLAMNVGSRTLRDYGRCWASTLGDREGIRALWAYRRAHRGEPGYRRAFAEWFAPQRRLLVTPDNRPYGRDRLPLGTLQMGAGDEPYLYHGWYWPEQMGADRVRRARQVASLVGTLPQGAGRLRLALQPAPETSTLTILARRWQDGSWVDQAACACRVAATPKDGLVRAEFPMGLPPGDYHLILRADTAPVEVGFFPRQSSYALASLTVEPAPSRAGEP